MILIELDQFSNDGSRAAGPPCECENAQPAALQTKPGRSVRVQFPPGCPAPLPGPSSSAPRKRADVQCDYASTEPSARYGVSSKAYESVVMMGWLIGGAAVLLGLYGVLNWIWG